MAVSSKALLDKLNTTCNKAILQAVALSFSRTHFDVELEHWLLKLLESPNNDLAFILRQYDIDTPKVKRELERSLSHLKTGSSRPGVLGEEIIDAIREAWVFGSLEQGAHKVRSAHLLAAILSDRGLHDRLTSSSPELARLPAEKLRNEMGDLLPRVASEENGEEAAAAAVAGARSAPASGGAPRSPAAGRPPRSTSSPST